MLIESRLRSHNGLRNYNAKKVSTINGFIYAGFMGLKKVNNNTKKHSLLFDQINVKMKWLPIKLLNRF